jgi:hypothetical protein
MQTFIDKFLGRNFHLAVLIVCLSFYLCLSGHMTGGEWTTLAGGIFAAFRVGDAVVNFIHQNDDKTVVNTKSDESSQSASLSTPAPCAPSVLGKKENE